MCGIAGEVSYSHSVIKNKDSFMRMQKVLEPRGPDQNGMYIKENVALIHSRLCVIDIENGIQPMTAKYGENEYTLIYNGELYNTEEIRDELKLYGHKFNGYSDTEVVLKAFVQWKEMCLEKFNGIFAFAIWDNSNKRLFFARDRMGVKPFFYTVVNNSFIFGSEIKAILEHKYAEAVIDEESIYEIMLIGPGRTPGCGVFKGINELKPASFGYFNKSGIKTMKYWTIKDKEHKDNLKQTIENVRYLVTDSIERQLISDVPIGTFLSGGLDSSIITKYTSDYYFERGLAPLNTFSVDYVDNDKNFVKSNFQPNTDNYYIDLMCNRLHTNHHRIVLDTDELVYALKDAMIARDMPGMADIDSSLLLFCKNVSPYAKVSLTGECADEIFGGYPWFFREDSLNSNTFPWSLSTSDRQSLLNPSIAEKVNLKEYIDYRYNESLAELEIPDTDTLETAEKRKISHLTLNCFMHTLIDRSERMASFNDFEIRVPFCDYRLVQYAWNIPWEMKAINGREKGLLRYVARKYLPSEIVDRRKSPYPKTHNPTYLAKVKAMLSEIMANPRAPINFLLNREYILNILETDGKSFTRPWFGQLMTGPQLMAYICQVNMWLEKYNPIIELN